MSDGFSFFNKLQTEQQRRNTPEYRIGSTLPGANQSAAAQQFRQNAGAMNLMPRSNQTTFNTGALFSTPLNPDPYRPARHYEPDISYKSQELLDLEKRIASATDFAPKSQYKQTGSGEKKISFWKSLLAGGNGLVYDGDEGYVAPDETYELVNRNKDVEVDRFNRRLQESNTSGDGPIFRDGGTYAYNVNALAQVDAITTDPTQVYKQMTSSEIGVYNYIYATEGADAAKKYLDELTPELNYRNRKAEEKEFKQVADEHPVQADFFRTFVGPMKGLALLHQSDQLARTGKIDQNAPTNKYSYVPTAVTNQRAQNVGEWMGSKFKNKQVGQQLGQWLYGLGASMSDNLWQMALTGGAQGGKGGQAALLALMGSGVAADTVIASKDKGLSDAQSYWMGLLAGGIEAATELIGLDNLYKTNWSGAAFGQLVKLINNQGLAEGSEEFVGSVANQIADLVVAGQDAELYQTIKGYTADGMPEKEAVRRAITDWFSGEVIPDTAAGYVSGVLFGAGASTMNFASMPSYYASIGQRANQVSASPNLRGTSGAIDAQVEIDKALSAAGSAKAAALARQVQSQMQGGRAPKDTTLGRLIVANMDAQSDVMRGVFSLLNSDALTDKERDDILAVLAGELDENGQMLATETSAYAYLQALMADDTFGVQLQVSDFEKLSDLYKNLSTKYESELKSQRIRRTQTGISAYTDAGVSLTKAHELADIVEDLRAGKSVEDNRIDQLRLDDPKFAEVFYQLTGVRVETANKEGEPQNIYAQARTASYKSTEAEKAIAEAQTAALKERQAAAREARAARMLDIINRAAALQSEAEAVDTAEATPEAEPQPTTALATTTGSTLSPVYQLMGQQNGGVAEAQSPGPIPQNLYGVPTQERFVRSGPARQQSRAEQIRSEQRQLRTRRSEIRAQHDASSAESVQNIDARMTAANQELKALRAEHEQLEKRHAQIDENIKKLENLEQNRHLSDKQSEHLNNLVDEYYEIERKLEGLDNRIAELENQLSELSEGRASEIARIEALTDEERAEIEQLESRMTELKTELAEETRKAEEAQREAEEQRKAEEEKAEAERAEREAAREAEEASLAAEAQTLMRIESFGDASVFVGDEAMTFDQFKDYITAQEDGESLTDAEIAEQFDKMLRARASERSRLTQGLGRSTAAQQTALIDRINAALRKSGSDLTVRMAKDGAATSAEDAELAEEGKHVNASWDKATGTITFSPDMTTQEIAQWVLAHEVLHQAAAYTGGDIVNEMQDAFKAMYDAGQLSGRVKDIMDNWDDEVEYKRRLHNYADTPQGRQDAKEELIGDMMRHVLPQTKFWNNFAQLRTPLAVRISNRLNGLTDGNSAFNTEAQKLADKLENALHLTEEQKKTRYEQGKNAESSEQRAEATTEETLNEDFSKAKFSVTPPYRPNTASYDSFVQSLSEAARETYDLFAGIHDYGQQNKVLIDGRAKDITQIYMTASAWNTHVSESPNFARVAKALAEMLPEKVKTAAGVNADGTIAETPFEQEFKMERAFIQRVVDSLPNEIASSNYATAGREVRVARGEEIESVGGENYRRALVEERRALYAAGKLPTKSIAGLGKDSWGAMGFLATNGKTGASGDFTTLCPQMYFNKGCFYCYRRAALTSGVNNKLVGENVWYTGEILQLTQDDITRLNKNGGLRIQSFGDWMSKFSTQLADLLIDAETVGLQIKIITKETSMIDTVALLKEQGLGKNLYFNLSADYVIEKQGEINNQDTTGALPRNPLRPYMKTDGGVFWKRASTVEEANLYRQRYPWVNTRIVATKIEEFIEGLRSPLVDVVTGYHGNLREFERVSSATGETMLQVEPLGDAGMPRFAFTGKSWVLEYEGKTQTHRALAKAIQDAGLEFQYYIKSCCITGRCATCEGKCGAVARDFNVKNATNADTQSVAYWQKKMTSAADNPLLLDQMDEGQAKALLDAEMASREKFSLRGESSYVEDFMDTDNLRLAKTMEARGAEPGEIRVATGWFKQSDGKWRKEFSSKDLKFKPQLDEFLPTDELFPAEKEYAELKKLTKEYESLLRKNQPDRVSDLVRLGREIKAVESRIQELANETPLPTVPLDRLIEWPELFKYYPQFANIPVVFSSLLNTGVNEGVAGQWSPTYQEIRIAPGLSKEYALDVLVHEVQHAIQDAEGFAYDSDQPYEQRRGEIEAYDAQKRRTWTDARRQKNPPKKFSISVVNGRAMPIIDITNSTSKTDTARNYIEALVSTNDPFSTILYDAQPVYIGPDLPKEYTSSRYTQGMRRDDRKIKMQAATNLDEMLLLAQDGDWQENLKEKHDIDAQNGWYYYKTEFAMPILRQAKFDHYNIYDATLVIRNDADGKSYLYDLIDLKEKEKANSPIPSTDNRSGIFGLKPSQSQDTTATSESQEGEAKKYSISRLVNTDGMTEEQIANAAPVVQSVLQRGQFADYFKSEYASYTTDRIEHELEYSIYEYEPDTTRTYIAWIDPRDFVRATTDNSETAERIKAEAGELDVARMRAEYQTPYLRIDFDTGEIRGHEGRHRMQAMADAGINYAPVLMDDVRGANTDAQPISIQKLEGQFSKYRGFYLHNALPMDGRYAEVIKKAFGTPRTDVKFSISEQDRAPAPTFYSQAQRVVEQYKGDKIGASSLVPYLKGHGVKSEEIKWSGIEQFLEGKKSVTKDEVLQFLRDNDLNIEIIVKDNADANRLSAAVDKLKADIKPTIEAWVDEFDPWDSETYTLDDYRQAVEDLLSNDDNEVINLGRATRERLQRWLLDADDVLNDLDQAFELDWNGRRRNSFVEKELYSELTNWDEYKVPGGTNYREYVYRLPTDGTGNLAEAYSNDAMQAHWGYDADNILVHARVQDFPAAIDAATGEPITDPESGEARPVLFVDEIQSDWHNEGHKYAYESTREARHQKLTEQVRAAFSEVEQKEAAATAAHEELLRQMQMLDADTLRALQKRLKEDRLSPHIVEEIDRVLARRAAQEELLRQTQARPSDTLFSSLYENETAKARRREENFTTALRDAFILAAEEQDGATFLHDALYSTLPKDWADSFTALAKEQYRLEREARLESLQVESDTYNAQRLANQIARGDHVVPDAPYSETYTDYVLKQLLREAAIKGYSFLAWTPGWVQEERWSDSYSKGYAIEYDQDVPGFLSKYGKQWGARLQNIELQTEDGDLAKSERTQTTITARAIPITDAMRESVIYTGQPKFSISPRMQRKFDDLLAQYGPQEPSSRDVRDVAIPKQSAEDNYVSRTARTVANAKPISEEGVDAVKKLIVGGKLSFLPESNKTLSDKAEKWVRDVGWGEAIRLFINDVSQGRVNGELVARGAILLNNASNGSDTQTFSKLMNYYTQLLHNASMGLEAAKIIQQLTPDGSLAGIMDVLREINDTVKRLNKAERGVGEITLNDELVAEYRAAKTDEARDTVVGKMAAHVASQIRTTNMDRWTAIRYLNMLGNFKTQVRNLAGNLIMQIMRFAKDTVAGAIDAVANANDRTVSVAIDKDSFKSGWDLYHTYADTIMGGGRYNDSMSVGFMQRIEDKTQVFGKTGWAPWDKTGGKAAEKYRTLTKTAMEKGDSIFCRWTFAESIGRFMAANHTTWEKATEPMRARAINKAIRDAAEATYHDNNALSMWVSNIARSSTTPRAARMLMEGLMPFRKTPANIAMRAYEYGPLSLIENTIKTIQYERAKNGKGNKSLDELEITGADIVNRWAKTFTGSVLVAIGVALAASGNLLGKKPDDEKEAALWEQMGYKEYSLRIGKMYWTLDWAAPACIPLFLGANLADAGAQNGLTLREFLGSVTRIADPLVEMSMLQGINDTIENAANYGTDSALGNLLINATWGYFSQGLSNTLLGQIKRASRNTRMQTYVDKNKALPDSVQRTVGKTSAKIPGWNYNQIPYIDAWGNVEQNIGTENSAGNAFANVLYQGFSPAYGGHRINESELLAEIDRLYKATGNKSVILERPDKYFNVKDENGVSKRLDLTADQYVVYAQTRGQTAQRVVSELINSQVYQTMTDQQKAEAIKEAYDYANQIGKNAVTEQFSLDSTAREVHDGAYDLDIPEAVYMTAYSQAKNYTENWVNAQGEKVQNSKSLLLMNDLYTNYPELTKEQILFLAEALGVNKTVRGWNKALVASKAAGLQRQYGKYN